MAKKQKLNPSSKLNSGTGHVHGHGHDAPHARVVVSAPARAVDTAPPDSAPAAAPADVAVAPDVVIAPDVAVAPAAPAVAPTPTPTPNPTPPTASITPADAPTGTAGTTRYAAPIPATPVPPVGDHRQDALTIIGVEAPPSHSTQPSRAEAAAAKEQEGSDSSNVEYVPSIALTEYGDTKFFLDDEKNHISLDTMTQNQQMYNVYRAQQQGKFLVGMVINIKKCPAAKAPIQFKYGADRQQGEQSYDRLFYFVDLKSSQTSLALIIFEHDPIVQLRDVIAHNESFLGAMVILREPRWDQQKRTVDGFPILSVSHQSNSVLLIPSTLENFDIRKKIVLPHDKPIPKNQDTITHYFQYHGIYVHIGNITFHHSCCGTMCDRNQKSTSTEPCFCLQKGRSYGVIMSVMLFLISDKDNLIGIRTDLNQPKTMHALRSICRTDFLNCLLLTLKTSIVLITTKQQLLIMFGNKWNMSIKMVDLTSMDGAVLVSILDSN